MKKFIIVGMVFLFTCGIFAAKVARFSELARPNSIVVDKNQIFINDGAVIYIYSATNFNLVKKFGSSGEGPAQFKIHPNLNNGGVLLWIEQNNIIVNSLGRISYFSRQGDYQKEIKTVVIPANFIPLGNKFVGANLATDAKAQYFSIAIYSASLNKEKELLKKVAMANGKINPIGATRFPVLYVYDNKIIVEGEGGAIFAFDNTGKTIFTIDRKTEKIKVTSSDKDRYLDFYKTDPRYKDGYDILKPMIAFPDYFPVIRNFVIAEKYIYVLTYLQKDQKSELEIYDLKGTRIKKLMVPILEMNVNELYPYTIKNNKIYQLVENSDEEEWELFVTDIK